jgi:hypothetical protein
VSYIQLCPPFTPCCFQDFLLRGYIVLTTPIFFHTVSPDPPLVEASITASARETRLS